MAKDIMLTGKRIPYVNYNKSLKDALKVMSQKN